MIRYIVGDVLDVLPTIEPASVDALVTSPPFLGLRDYADDPREIGMESSPGEYIGVLLDVVAAAAPALTPDGSIAFEIGDTSADSGGAGGDYNPGGKRDGQPKWKANRHDQGARRKVGGDRPGGHHLGGDGWPLGKSQCMIPQLFAASLAYGRNLLTGEVSPAGQWRVRNFICWGRTNPSPGRVGDKVRYGSSYITVATRNRTRYWDPDGLAIPRASAGRFPDPDTSLVPMLDWLIEVQDGEFTWVLPNPGLPRSPIEAQTWEHEHFATWPEELVRRLVKAMVPPGGTVLDPFVGTGMTLAAAQGIGRKAIGVDLDPRNVEIAREQVGMFLDVEYHDRKRRVAAMPHPDPVIEEAFGYDPFRAALEADR
jgi:hypothetical protein